MIDINPHDTNVVTRFHAVFIAINFVRSFLSFVKAFQGNVNGHKQDISWYFKGFPH